MNCGPAVIGAGVMALFLSTEAAAQTPQVQMEPRRDTSVRLAGMVGVDYALIGAAVSRPITRWIALEGMAAAGDASDGAAGLLEGLARFGFIGTRHAITLGVGPSLLWARQLDGVAIAQSEVAYEYRTSTGWSALVGYGMGVALNTSGMNSCSGGTFWAGCGVVHREQFHPGDLTARFRLAVGRAF